MQELRRLFGLIAVLLWAACGGAWGRAGAAEVPPNFVVIFADDLGYGDLGCFGHPTIRTPQLDRMAREGQRWTSFYVAASVCTPSRAGLITGRYPIRSGMCSGRRRVLFPDSAGGLPQSEVTLAEALKDLGYATAAVGKWHLGHLQEYLPTSHGFDRYFGIPYSNDMDRVGGVGPSGREAFWKPKVEYWNVPLMRNEEIIERPANQNTITRRYTEEAVRFIRENRERPFFLYLAHNLPHVPLFRHPDFAGVSRRGRFGDVVEEIDWSVGRIRKTLEDLGLTSRTLVVFTSDNGPWLPFRTHGGSAGLLRGGKGSTWEGGMREPTVFWWPGRVAPGVIMEMGSTLDLFPTLVSLAGGEVPADREYDGYDLSPVLLRGDSSPRDEMIYYWGETIYAARRGAYKAHFTTFNAYRGEKPVAHDPPLLFDLEHDPSEQYNIAEEHPEAIEEIRELVSRHRATVKPVPSQLTRRLPRDAE